MSDSRYISENFARKLQNVRRLLALNLYKSTRIRFRLFFRVNNVIYARIKNGKHSVSIFNRTLFFLDFF